MGDHGVKAMGGHSLKTEMLLDTFTYGKQRRSGVTTESRCIRRSEGCQDVARLLLQRARAYALLTVLRAAHLPPEEPKNTAAPHPEQLGGMQGDARAGVPLSVSVIRRLFWRLVLATQQKVERILAWSTWRRWHQGIAQYWHDKRRAGPEVQL